MRIKYTAQYPLVVLFADRAGTPVSSSRSGLAMIQEGYQGGCDNQRPDPVLLQA